MEPIESSETSAYNNTLTPGTYPKEKKLQSKHGESLKSRILSLVSDSRRWSSSSFEQDGRINVTMREVRATVVAVEKQVLHILSVCL
jgi:hypothetical protein